MIKTELHDGGILEAVISRPPVNAFSIGLLDKLAELLRTLDGHEGVRCVLIRAEGKGFCGGGDVKEVERLEGFEGILGQAQGSLELSLATIECAVPVICAPHNYCVGVGVLFAASADVIVAGEGTRFVLAEIDNGATSGAIQALRLMPEMRVRSAMMTAEPVMAEELVALGSVLRAVPESELAEHARATAGAIANKPPSAMRRLKESLNNTMRADRLRAIYRAELSYTYELNIMGEASRGRQAFIDKTRTGY